jgi:chaperonin cofactor prefoldin
MIKKEDINNRILAIRGEMEKLRTNFVKLDACLQECTYWLVQIEKEECADNLEQKESENGQTNNESPCEAA